MQEIIDLTDYISLVEGRHGHFLYNKNDFYLGYAIEKYGECCEHEVQLFTQFIQPNMIVWDIGANMGVLTIPFANMVGKQGQVIAFEPQPEVFHLLAGNIAINCLTQARALPFALSNRTEIINIPDIDYSQQGNFGGVTFLTNDKSHRQVESRKIDDLTYLPPPNFIKIDVEGMELQVLEGGVQLIKQARPIIYCENDRVEKSEELIEYFWELGYKLYWHIPALFNKDNYFLDAENIYGNICSLNMVCLPKEHEINIQEPEITDKTSHPKNK